MAGLAWNPLPGWVQPADSLYHGGMRTFLYVALVLLLTAAVVCRWRRSRAAATTGASRHPSLWVPASLSLLLFLALGLGGTGLYRQQKNTIRAHKQQELEGVARLKRAQLIEWLERNRREVEQFQSKDNFFTRAILEWLEQPDSTHRMHIESMLETLRYTAQWDSIQIIDTAGALRLSVGRHTGLHDETMELALQAFAQRQPVFSGFYRTLAAPEHSLHLDYFVPLPASRGNRSPAMLVVMLDPEDYLIPLLDTWPSASPSAETLLLRRDPDRLVVLNRLRHSPAPPLATSLAPSAPLFQSLCTGAVTAGTHEARDYRGMPVLGHCVEIPGMPWLLIAKVDQAEIYAPIRRYAWATLWVTALLYILSLAISAAWWWREKARFHGQLYRAALDRSALQERFEFLTKHASDCILVGVLDPKGAHYLVDANEKALTTYGLDPTRVQGLPVSELAAVNLAEQLDRLRSASGSLVHETVYRGRDGQPIPVESSTARIAEGDRLYFVSIVRDISERKRAEQEILRLNRLYEALSQTSRTITSTQNERQLLTAACNTAVNLGGLKLAWVGARTDNDAALRCIASSGQPADPIAEITVLTVPGQPERRGPSGRALASGEPYICNDIETDDNLTPWRPALRRHDLRAAAAFPIDEHLCWNVYAAETGFFDARTIALLQQITAEIRYARRHLATQERRRRAEQLLRASEQRLRRVIEEFPMALAVMRDIQSFEYINRKHRELFGMQGARGDFEGWVRAIADPQASHAELLRDLRELMNRARLYDGESGAAVFRVRTNYGLRDIEFHYVSMGQQGIWTLHDISPLRQAMRQIQRERDHAQQYLDVAEVILVGLTPGLVVSMINRKGCEILGRAEHEVVGKAWFSHFVPAGQELDLSLMYHAAVRPPYPDECIRNHEYPVLTRDGRIRAIAWHTHLLQDSRGELIGLLSSGEDITEKRQAQMALRDSELRYRRLFEHNPQPMYVYARDSLAMLAVNPSALEQYGYTREEFLTLQLPDLWPPERREELKCRLDTLSEPLQGPRAEAQRRRDGGIFPAELSPSAITLDGQPATLVLVLDVTEKLRAEEQLRLAAKVYAASGESILILDSERRVVSANEAFRRITGFRPAAIHGSQPDFLCSPEHGSFLTDVTWQKVESVGHWQGEVWIQKRDTGALPAWMTISAIRDETGQTTHYALLFSDQTERRQALAHIEFLAHYDALTRLPNRTLFRANFQQGLALARRKNQCLGIMFLDLDRFKTINDSLGHLVGDELLLQVATRLRECIREQDTVARFGGDEFVLLLLELRQSEDAAAVAHKILKALARPFAIQGHELTTTPSIGISMYPADGEDFDTLIRNADTAMYRAKENGRNNVQFYMAEMNVSVSRRLRLESNLRRALERGEMSLHYQPQVALDDGRIVGVEALLRWHCAELGEVSPARFIPTAEDTGLILSLGEWVLQQVAAQCAAWQSTSLADIPVAVNISPLQLRSNDFLARVQACVRDCAMRPELLELELTESTIMHQAHVTELLKDLKSLGLRLAIDDFGTGYSNLQYLQRLPIDRIKIDRSLIGAIAEHPSDGAIVCAIIQLAQSLGMEVVAEGVETPEQVAFLRQAGCHVYQGFVASVPLTAEELPAFLAAHRPAPRFALLTMQ